MEPMEFSIALPRSLHHSSVPREWGLMKQRLHAYHQHSSSSHQFPPTAGLVQAFLINIASEQVQHVFNTFGLSYEEGLKFSKVLHNLEELCLPRFLVIYNRFKFFTCKQSQGMKFESFLHELLGLAENCEFGDLKDILLKDCIIHGILDNSIREDLLRTEELDYAKTLTICKRRLIGSNTFDKSTMCIQPVHVNASTGTCDNERLLLQSMTVDEPHYFDNEELTSNDLDIDNAVAHRELNYGLNQAEMNKEENRANLQGYTLSLPFMSPSFSFDLGQPPTNESIQSNEKESGVRGNQQQYSDTMLPKETTELTYSSDKTEHQVAEKDRHNTKKYQYINNALQTNLNAIGIIRDPQKSMKEQNSDKQNVNPYSARCTNSNESNIKNINICSQDPLFVCHICKAGFGCRRALIEHESLTHIREKEVSTSQWISENFKHSEHSQTYSESLPVNSGNAETYTESLHCNSENAIPVSENIDEDSSNVAANSRLQSQPHTGSLMKNVDRDSLNEEAISRLNSQSHTDSLIKEFVCDVCSKCFAWKAAFVRHRNIHLGTKPYTCEVCGNSFSESVSLKRHMLVHSDKKPFGCEMCSTKFKCKATLRLHRKTHSENRPFSCQQCGYAFKRASHLEYHLKTHMGVKPHICTVCSSSFLEASKLKSHMRKHSGDKPYTCTVCGASFAWTSSYTRHLRTHTGDRPYCCEVCGSKFADHTTLTRHRRRHTKERPYPCTVCAMTFTDGSSLQRHTKTHTLEKSYTCEKCGASFAVKCNLDRHIRTHSKL